MSVRCRPNSVLFRGCLTDYGPGKSIQGYCPGRATWRTSDGYNVRGLRQAHTFIRRYYRPILPGSWLLLVR